MTEIKLPPGDGGPPTPKPWYRSRTLWVNLGAILVLVGGLLSGEHNIQNFVAEAFPYILAIINIILRIGTTQPLSPK